MKYICIVQHIFNMCCEIGCVLLIFLDKETNMHITSHVMVLLFQLLSMTNDIYYWIISNLTEK